jgi:hypothetical protein
MMNLFITEMPRKAEVIAINSERQSVAMSPVWKIKRETVNISYGRILNWPVAGDSKNNNTLEN